MAMFEDENLPKNTEHTIPRKLDAISIEALQQYIVELQDEIEKIKEEILKKEKLQIDAKSIFKT